MQLRLPRVQERMDLHSRVDLSQSASATDDAGTSANAGKHVATDDAADDSRPAVSDEAALPARNSGERAAVRRLCRKQRASAACMELGTATNSPSACCGNGSRQQRGILSVRPLSPPFTAVSPRRIQSHCQPRKLSKHCSASEVDFVLASRNGCESLASRCQSFFRRADWHGLFVGGTPLRNRCQ